MSLGTYSSRSELISYGALISLIANIIGYVFGSLLASERLVDRIQATAFVTPTSEVESRFFKPKSKAINGDLFVLLETFLGEQKCAEVIHHFEQNYNEDLPSNQRPSRLFIEY